MRGGDVARGGIRSSRVSRFSPSAPGLVGSCQIHDEAFPVHAERPWRQRRIGVHLGKAVHSLRQFLGGLELRVQISLMAAALSVLLVALVSTGAAWIGEAEASRDTGGRMTQLASELAHRLDIGMSQRYREIGQLAQLAPLRPVWTGDPAVLRGVLDQLQSSFPNYAWIGFATPDGLVRASTGGLLEHESVAERPWFKNGLHHPAVSDVHEAILLSRLLGPNDTNEPFRFVDIAFPVVDASGATLGVLSAHLNSAWVGTLRSEFTTLLDATGVDPVARTDISVLSADGHVIIGDKFGTPYLDAATARQVTLKGVGLRTARSGGRSYLEGMAATRGGHGFPGFGWIVVARQRTSVAYAPVRAVVGAVVGAGAVVAALGIILSYLLGARIARPMRNLCDDAERIGRSTTGATLERATGCWEVSQLSHSLRSLVRRLGMAERQLVDAEERANTKSVHAAQQIELLRRLADTDPMTGLLNRRGFLDAVKRSLAAPPMQNGVAGAAIPGFTIPGVLIIDIDHFKRVNDRHGHAVGDAVIQTVAKVIQSTVRQNDLPARFGGEEFVVVVPDATDVALATLAERIRGAVRRPRIINGVSVEVSVSIGVAITSVNDADVQDTIDRADVALYQAKESGRNCVRFSNDAGSMALAAA